MVSCTSKDKPFIFISYAHGDSDCVFPVLEGIASNGYNIWYDHGIEINTTWSDEIANAILASEIFVVFISKISMASNYVRSEVEFALGKNIRVVPVYLDGMDVLPPGLALALHSTQGIASGDVNMITFKLCRWLVQNLQNESWKPAKSIISPVLKSSPAAEARQERQEQKEQHERYEPPKRESFAQDEDEGSDNYWHSGLHGNMDEYQKYLRIKDMLDGKRSPISRGAGGPNAVSQHSCMSMLLWIIFFLNATEILKTYIDVGFYQRPFSTALLMYGLSSVVFYWYFFRRSTARFSFLEKLLPGFGTLQSLLYWTFLLGWLVFTLDLERLKVWLPLIDSVLKFVRVDVDFTRYSLAYLPQIPSAAKLTANLAMKISGVILAADMALTAVTTKR